MSNQVYSNSLERYSPSPIYNIFTNDAPVSLIVSTIDGEWFNFPFTSCNGTTGYIDGLRYKYTDVRDIGELGNPGGTASGSAVLSTFISIVTDGVYSLEAFIEYLGIGPQAPTISTIGFSFHFEKPDGVIDKYGQKVFMKQAGDEQMTGFLMNTVRYLQAGTLVKMVYTNMITSESEVSSSSYLKINKL